jgi:hypothetical protein
MSTSEEQNSLKINYNLNENQYNNVPKRSRVFISYSHDSNKHKENVFRLSERLCNEGIDCNIDQYETSPPEGWFQWMINQIEEADFVLIVCTKNYEKRFKGKDEIGKGRGVKWEGAIITQELYYSEANNKCIPIVFSPEDSEYIPSILKSATYYVLNMEEINDETYDELYARLTYQKLVIKPDIGELRLITPKYCSSSVSTQKKEGEIAESNHKPVIGELRKITPEPQSSKIHETFTSLSNEKIENSEDENHFKRENAEKIIEKVVRPLRDCAKYIKPYFENGDYILNLENKTVSLNLKFDGYEFFQICEKSNRFCLKDENLVFTYKRDEILNRSMSRIISHLDNYREHFIALKTAIENLNTSNVPISFESDIAVLIENESKKHALAEDERKEEFLFKLYATVVTGKDAFSGHDWATTLKKTKSKEVLEIIKKDPYSNETFTKIECLKNEIILNIDKLINELNSLDEELQNAYCL